MEKIPKLFVVVVVVFIVVVVVWGDWEEKRRGSFFVRAERKKQKSKKSKKSKKIMQQVLFGLIFVTRGGAINNHLLQNKINFNSRKLLSPVRPSSRRRRI